MSIRISRSSFIYISVTSYQNEVHCKIQRKQTPNLLSGDISKKLWIEAIKDLLGALKLIVQ